MCDQEWRRTVGMIVTVGAVTDEECDIREKYNSVARQSGLYDGDELEVQPW